MSLLLEIDGAVANLLINRIDQRNAFTLPMWEKIPALLDQAKANSDVRLLVIRSAEKNTAFCAGADIRELLKNKDDTPWRAANQAAINRAQSELANFQLPTVAIIEGDCIGGGCGIAMACDLRVATTPRARFGITPAKLGLVYPLHDVKLLVDLVGPGQAKRLLYTGKLIPAFEAQQIGLIEELTDRPEGLLEELLSASPHSILEMKKFVRRVLNGQTGDDDQSLRTFAAAFDGKDFLEGTTAFVEKRKPNFGNLR